MKLRKLFLMFPVTFYLRRWFICLLFHRKHFKLTDSYYAKATGLQTYCNKCYGMGVLVEDKSGFKIVSMQ